MALNLEKTFAVLKPDMSVALEDVSPSLYADLDAKYSNFASHALVAMYRFSSDWGSWECHPAGDEIVILLSGAVTMVLRIDGQEQATELSEPGGFVVIPRNTWHTARVAQPASMLFITPGEGTQHSAD